MDLFTIAVTISALPSLCTGLTWDCCVLAYSLCSSWSISTRNTVFFSYEVHFTKVLLEHVTFSLPVSCLSSSFFKFYVWFLLYFFTSEVSFFNPQKILYAKFGKQIYYKSLTQLKFRSVILGCHAVQEDLCRVTCLHTAPASCLC